MSHSDKRTVFALLISLSLLLAQNAAAAEDENGSVSALWRIQSVPFEFRGEPVSYTCESFKKKVRAILIAVGVHPSLIVQARCAPAAQAPFLRAPDEAKFGRESESIASSPAMHTTKLSSRISAKIALAAPAIATDENIKEATTFNSERKLVAKVNDEALPTPSDIPLFPAVWAPIELNDTADTWLEAGDCELLRQLSRQVFPRIGVEVTKTKLVCSPSVISKPELEVRALVPMIRVKQHSDAH